MSLVLAFVNRKQKRAPRLSQQQQAQQAVIARLQQKAAVLAVDPIAVETLEDVMDVLLHNRPHLAAERG